MHKLMFRALPALVLPWLGFASPVLAAEAWMATHTVTRGDTIHQEDVTRQAVLRAPLEAVPADQNIVGQEAKRTIYPARPITERDIGPRSAVKVNTQVQVVWKAPGLTLELDGRALDSGALGDEVRVLNTSTSRTVRGVVVGDSLVEVRNVQ